MLSIGSISLTLQVWLKPSMHYILYFKSYKPYGPRTWSMFVRFCTFKSQPTLLQLSWRPAASELDPVKYLLNLSRLSSELIRFFIGTLLAFRNSEYVVTCRKNCYERYVRQEYIHCKNEMAKTAYHVMNHHKIVYVSNSLLLNLAQPLVVSHVIS